MEIDPMDKRSASQRQSLEQETTPPSTQQARAAHTSTPTAPSPPSSQQHNPQHADPPVATPALTQPSQPAVPSTSQIFRFFYGATRAKETFEGAVRKKVTMDEELLLLSILDLSTRGIILAFSNQVFAFDAFAHWLDGIFKTHNMTVNDASQLSNNVFLVLYVDVA